MTNIRQKHALRFCSSTLALVLAMQAAEASGATLHVPSEYPTVNAGLDAAAKGDTVLVAPGTYTIADERQVDFGYGVFPVFAIGFLKNGVVLKSESGPGVTALDLMGQSGSDPLVTNWVLLAVLLPSAGTVVDGFTVTGSPVGYNGMWISECGTVTIRDCIFRDLDVTSLAYSGGGIACGASTLVLERTVFRNCHAVEGGGVWYYEGDVPAQLQGDITVDGCTFENCSQRALQIRGDDLGLTRVATVRDCVFRGNSSDQGAGGLLLHNYTSTVEGCLFVDNLSLNGGAASLFCNFTILDCLFVRNSVIGNGAGGALNASPAAGGSGVVGGCTFFSNSQQWTSNGGASMFLAVAPGGGTFDLQNNIIAGSLGAKAVELFGGAVTNSCNVFWNNAAGDVQGFALDPTDRIVDPMFCDVALDDFTLNEVSPCLPANSLGCGQIGAFGQGCGSVSLQPTSWARVKALYGRTPR